MVKRKRISWYEACYLVANDYQVAIEDGGGNKTSFYVPDSSMVTDDLETYSKDENLLKFAKGITKLREQYRQFWQEKKYGTKKDVHVKPDEHDPALLKVNESQKTTIENAGYA